MLKEEFLAVDHGLGNIFNGAGAVFVGFDVVLCRLLFFGQGRAAECREVQQIDNFRVGFALSNPKVHAA